MVFSSLDPRSLALNPFSLIAEDWMLVTAGVPGDWNTMTASWGGLGHLWNRDVAFVFIRPTRHTFGFMEREAFFSLSFFDPGMRQALGVCGRLSGRDADKAKAAGLTPRSFELPARAGDPAARVQSFEESRIVFACRKLHAQDLDPACFVDPSIAGHYESLDWHRLYVGAVEAAWKRD
ncbi:MAG: flavin reductase [Spirochaetaceae bacterium]|nr:flavin reductase [Spirochaetaceae bacterium]